MTSPVTDRQYPVETLWAIVSSISAGILTLLIGFFIALGAHSFTILVLFLFALYGMLRPLIFLWTFHYSVDENFLFVKQGLISRMERNLPYSVIQDLSVNQNLLDRILGFASLTIENAAQGAGAPVRVKKSRYATFAYGFSGNRILIPGMKLANAKALRDIVLAKMKEFPATDSHSGL